MRLVGERTFLFILTFATRIITSQTIPLTANEAGAILRYPSNGGNYRNNELKQWDISASSASMKVMIELLRIDVEQSSTCGYDWLRFYDSNWSLKRTLCGRDTSPTACFITTGSTAHLRWKSDSSITRTGWRVRYKAVRLYSSNCYVPDTTTPQPPTTPDPTSLTARSFTQTLQHPQSRQYGNNENLRWTITAENSLDRVKLTLTFMDIELHPGGCLYDSLKYYEGSSVIKTLCGRDVQRDACYISTVPSVILRWKSDHSVVKEGWKIDYRSVPQSSSCIPTTTPAPTTTPTTTTTPQPTTAQSGSALIARQWVQYLKHPNSGNYGNYENIRWEIRADDTSRRVQLRLTSASIEGSRNSCPFDYLLVFNELGGARERTYCGNLNTDISSSSALFVSRDSTVYLQWKTDGSVTRSGWQLEYKTIPSSDLTGTQPVTVPLTFPSTANPYTVLIATYTSNIVRDRTNWYPITSFYENNQDRVWEIRSVDATKKMELKLISVGIEISPDCTADSLKVFEDYRFNRYTNIARTFCGRYSYGEIDTIAASIACIISLDNVMYLKWRTNGWGQGRGWEMQYRTLRQNEEGCLTASTANQSTGEEDPNEAINYMKHRLTSCPISVPIAAVICIIAALIILVIVAIVVATILCKKYSSKKRKVGATQPAKPITTVSGSVAPSNAHVTNKPDPAHQWKRAGTFTRVGSLAVRNMPVPDGKANQLPPLQKTEDKPDKPKTKKPKKPKNDSVDPRFSQPPGGASVPPNQALYPPPGMQNVPQPPAYPPGPFMAQSRPMGPTNGLPGPNGTGPIPNGMHFMPPVYPLMPPPPPGGGMSHVPPMPPPVPMPTAPPLPSGVNPNSQGPPQPFLFQPQLEPPSDPLDAPPSYSDATSHPSGLQSYHQTDIPDVPPLDANYPTDKIGVPLAFNYQYRL